MKSPFAILFVLLLFFSSTGFSQFKNPRNIAYNWKTDTGKTQIDLTELIAVGPQGLCPALNNPPLSGLAQGMEEYYSKEPVLALEIKGTARAYPLNVLTYHEVANDTLAGTPVLITYCPLTDSPLAFERTIDLNGNNKTLSFGVSGMLRHGNLVIFDKETESWWQQLSGRGITGECAGIQLKQINGMVISVNDFFSRYPNGKIISIKTGHTSLETRYGQAIYTNYDSPDNDPYEIYIAEDMVDNRLSPMERVINVQSGSSHKIYPFSVLSQEHAINDVINHSAVAIFYKKGTVSVLDKKDISESRDVGSAVAFNAEVNGKPLKFVAEDNHFRDHKTGSKWDITGYCYAGALKGTQLETQPCKNHFAFTGLAFNPGSTIYHHAD